MKRYAAIGVKVHITEMSVICNKTRIFKGEMHCPYNTTWPAEALQRQANIFNYFLLICLEEPNCMSFETWGYTDKYSFMPPPQFPLPFDKEMKKKPAYEMMLKSLQEFPRNHPAVLAKLSTLSEE